MITSLDQATKQLECFFGHGLHHLEIDHALDGFNFVDDGEEDELIAMLADGLYTAFWYAPEESALEPFKIGPSRSQERAGEAKQSGIP